MDINKNYEDLSDDEKIEFWNSFSKKDLKKWILYRLKEVQDFRITPEDVSEFEICKEEMIEELKKLKNIIQTPFTLSHPSTSILYQTSVLSSSLLYCGECGMRTESNKEEFCQYCGNKILG